MKRKGDTRAKPTKKAKLQPKRVTRKQQEDIEYEKDEISLEEESAAEENARKSTKKVTAAQKKTNIENDKEEEEISDYDALASRNSVLCVQLTKHTDPVNVLEKILFFDVKMFF